MKSYIVRVRRGTWFRTDYVGTYLAASAVAALSLAARDPYFPNIVDNRIVLVEAIETDLPGRLVVSPVASILE